MRRSTIEYLSLALKVSVLTVGGVLTLLYFIPGSGFDRIWSYLATIVLVFIPNFARFLHIKIDDRLELAYYLFLIPAMVLGIDFELYRTIPPMDKVVHTASGVLSAFAASSFLRQTTGTKKLWFVGIFMMGFVALMAVLWECFEFFVDQAFGGHMQQLHTVGVSDTMWDMIVALIGGAVVTMFLYFRKDQLKDY